MTFDVDVSRRVGARCSFRGPAKCHSNGANEESLGHYDRQKFGGPICGERIGCLLTNFQEFLSLSNTIAGGCPLDEVSVDSSGESMGIRQSKYIHCEP